MPIQAPPWALPDDIEEHGAYFLCCFADRAHFENAMRTGDMRRPASIRRAAKLVANPIGAQRETLRQRVVSAQRAVKDAESKIAAARADIAASPFLAHKAEQDLKAQTARLGERMDALKRYRVDLELFDLLHENDT